MRKIIALEHISLDASYRLLAGQMKIPAVALHKADGFRHIPIQFLERR